MAGGHKSSEECSECHTCQTCVNGAPVGVYFIPGSGQLSEFPSTEFLNCPEEGSNIVECVSNRSLCPRAYPPTTVCVRDCTQFSAVAGINFINGDLVIGDPEVVPVVVDPIIPAPIPAATDLIDIFPNLLGVNGSIYIVGTKYRRISGFERLRSVTGSIVIVNNINLISHPTFNSLISVGGQVTSPAPTPAPILREVGESQYCGTSAIIIANNHALQSVTGFENVRQVQNGIVIANNGCLVQICGFIHLYRSNRVVLKSNHRLRRVSGFGYLDSLNVGLYILDNSEDGEQDLVIKAFNSLESVGNLVVIGNSTLRELKLESLHTVYGTVAIRSNPFMENISSTLQYVDNIYLERNKMLVRIQLPNLRQVNTEFNIASNCSLLTLDTANELHSIGHGLLIADNRQLNEIKGFERLKYIGARCVEKPEEPIPVTCGTCGCTTGLVFDWNSITVIDCVVTNPFEIGFFDSSVNACNYVLPEAFFRSVCNTETPCGVLPPDVTSPDVLSFSLAVYHNQRLRVIGGFNNLRHLVSNLYIVDNASLQTIKSFSQLAYALDIWIRNNPSLRYIIGLFNLMSLRDLVIYDASGLVDVNGLKSIDFAQKIATEAKIPSAIKIPRGAVPTVIGYTLYYSYEHGRC